MMRGRGTCFKRHDKNFNCLDSSLYVMYYSWALFSFLLSLLFVCSRHQLQTPLRSIVGAGHAGAATSFLLQSSVCPSKSSVPWILTRFCFSHFPREKDRNRIETIDQQFNRVAWIQRNLLFIFHCIFWIVFKRSFLDTTHEKLEVSKKQAVSCLWHEIKRDTNVHVFKGENEARTWINKEAFQRRVKLWRIECFNRIKVQICDADAFPEYFNERQEAYADQNHSNHKLKQALDRGFYSATKIDLRFSQKNLKKLQV